MKKRILLVEDEASLVLILKDRLNGEGYSVESESNGLQAVQRACSEPFDLMILDLMLPGQNGFDVCRDLRRSGFAAPILMLTARSQLTDKVVGLKLGADDYLTKPFEMMELLARVEALLRRQPLLLPNHSAFSFGEISVDFRKAEVYRGGEAVQLSAQEFRLLQYFIEHRQQTLSRNELLDEVWGYEAIPTTRTVDVHVSWLRQKLEENPAKPRFIITVHGLGYKFTG